MKLRLLLALILIALNLGCTKTQKGSQDTVVIGLNSKPASLDPRYAKDAAGMRILSLMFHSFVRVGPGLTVVGDAASEWNWKQNKLELKVPKPLVFHNGRAVTSEDLLFTFEAYQQKDCPFRSSLSGLQNVNVSETDESFTVELSFDKFSAKFLASDLPIIRILPKDLVEQQGAEFGKNPVGSHHFEYEKNENNSIFLKLSKASKDIAIKRLEFKSVSDEFTLMSKLKKGQVHLVQNDLPKDKIASLKKNPNLEVVSYPGLAFTYVLVNFKNPALSKKAFRKALAHSLDLDQIIKFKLGGLAQRATGLLSPATAFYNRDLIPVEFNLQKAKQLLKNLASDSSELVLKTSHQRSARDTGLVLAKMMSQTGASVRVESYEWATFFESVQKGDFDMATMKWVGAIDPDLYRIAFHSSEVHPGRNRGHYLNQTLDKLLDEGLSIADPDKRLEHYFKVQKIVFEDLAVLPLWYDQQVAVIHKSLKGYKPVANSDYFPVLKATLK
ncbi:MAG: ABC transporter substrate-binding protein [Bdellovibrionales bacterium]|nr:ABC transporter substrate-binding protein [Bdellovibrionales bacterium]